MDYDVDYLKRKVLPDEESIFVIDKYCLTVSISRDFNSALYKEHYILKKIKEGEGYWIITSKAEEKQYELINVKSDEDYLKCVKLKRDDNKVSYKILFNTNISIDDIYEFIIVFKESMKPRMSYNKNNLVKEEFIYNHDVTFANICKYLDLKFEMVEEGLYIANNSDKNLFHYTEKTISPYDTKIANLVIKRSKVTKKTLFKILTTIGTIILSSIATKILDNYL